MRRKIITTITADPYNGLDYVAAHELASANLEASIFARINEVKSGNPLLSTNNDGSTAKWHS